MWTCTSRRVAIWNQWREEHPEVEPNLSGSDFSRAYLHSADLREARLSRANLYSANVSGTNLREAHLWYTIFGDVNLRQVQGLRP